MTRIAGIEQPGWLGRIVYWMARRRFGNVPAPLRVTAHNGAIFAAMCGYEAMLERAHALDHRSKHLVDLLVATRVGCPFCMDIGAALGRTRGVTEAELLALPVWRDSPLFSKRDRLFLTYAEAMTATPVDVPDALFEELRSALGPAGLVELTAVIAWENYRARFNDAIGARSEGYALGASCRVPGRALTA